MSGKKTALYQEHLNLGGRIIDFGGWMLPVQYSGLMDEHAACRTKAGLFDVSHMGEFFVEGKDAQKFLNHVITNDLTKIIPGQAQYTVICHPDGGIVDDWIIYKRTSEKFLVVVNAANIEKDFSHLERMKAKYSHLDFQMRNESSQFSQIAVQGPMASEIIQKLIGTEAASLKTFYFLEKPILEQVSAFVARTGYTGEDGFELYVPWNDGPKVWRSILDIGTPLGLKPCGLGARDTLRLEVKYPLYGQDLDDKTTPIEANLGWVVKPGKPEEFEGKPALNRQKETQNFRKWVGFKMKDRTIARHGYSVFSSKDANSPCGQVTSGTLSPSLGFPLGTAYVEPQLSAVGSTLWIEIRSQRFEATVVETPFYKRPY